jgi:hypothetical protein
VVLAKDRVGTPIGHRRILSQVQNALGPRRPFLFQVRRVANLTRTLRRALSLRAPFWRQAAHRCCVSRILRLSNGRSPAAPPGRNFASTELMRPAGATLYTRRDQSRGASLGQPRGLAQPVQMRGIGVSRRRTMLVRKTSLCTHRVRFPKNASRSFSARFRNCLVNEALG